MGQRQTQDGGKAPDCGAERENKGNNRANKPPHFKKTNSLPPNKQNKREQGKNKTWENLFLFKMSQCCWGAGAGSVSRLGGLSLYNVLVKKALVDCWQQLELAEPMVMGSCGPPFLGKRPAAVMEVLENSPEPRENKRESFLCPFPVFKGTQHPSPAVNRVKHTSPIFWLQVLKRQQTNLHGLT